MTLLSCGAALVRAVRKQLQTIALLSFAHFDYERAGVSQFVSHFRLHPFALAVNLQDALDASAKVIRARTRSSFPNTLAACGGHRARRRGGEPNVGVLSGPRQYYAMLRNDTMTSMDRLQPGRDADCVRSRSRRGSGRSCAVSLCVTQTSCPFSWHRPAFFSD